MKLTAKVKLIPDEFQASVLKQTLEIANAACNAISEQAWDNKTFRQFPLHKLVYHSIRKSFLLTAQVVVRCISKVADAYKVDHARKRKFRLHGAITYDDRILSWNMNKSEVSIWTTNGRERISFVCGERQRQLLTGQRGESDLCLIDGKFYLFATCDVETPEPVDVKEFLGIDLGIVNLASDSDGESFAGEDVEENRRIFSHRRRNLQRNGSKSARRKLKKLSGKQARFQKHTNHVISKRIVQKAQDTARGIALEDLGGIRERVTVFRRKQRARHANWAFYQLRQFVTYKAAIAGISVVAVDPRNTSRTCPVCGCVDKANRRSQSIFSCVSCGYSANADTNAAVIIAARAVINRPMVSTRTELGTILRPLAAG